MIIAAIIILFVVIVAAHLEPKQHDDLNDKLRAMEANHRNTIYGEEPK